VNVELFKATESVTTQSSGTAGALMHAFVLLGPNLWISHDWEYRYSYVGHRYLKTKAGGMDQKTSKYLV
jgi:hypothetical protein